MRQYLLKSFCVVLFLLALNCKGTEPKAVLQLAPSTLAFTAGFNGGFPHPAPQSIAVNNTTGGNLSPAVVTVSYNPVSSPWLQITQSGTGNTQTLVNNIAAGSLTVGGPYTAVVSVTSEGAGNNPQTYQVTLMVAIPGPPIYLWIDTLKGRGADTAVDVITQATKKQNLFLVKVSQTSYPGDQITMATLNYGDNWVDTLVPGIDGFQPDQVFPLYHWWYQSGLLSVNFKAFTQLGGISDTTRMANVLKGLGKKNK